MDSASPHPRITRMVLESTFPPGSSCKAVERNGVVAWEPESPTYCLDNLPLHGCSHCHDDHLVPEMATHIKGAIDSYLMVVRCPSCTGMFSVMADWRQASAFLDAYEDGEEQLLQELEQLSGKG